MDNELTLVEHLGELRKRLIIGLSAFFLALLASFPFASKLFDILMYPGREYIKKLVFFAPQEAFMMYMRISFFSALVFSMPVILSQVWAFLSPAAGGKLKKFAFGFIVFSSLAFISGCLFAYFVIIPPSLKFLLSFAKDNMEPMISTDRYISFVLGFELSCAAVFQAPVISFILAKLGIITPRFLRSKYKYAIVVIMVLAAIITPTSDIFNMMLLAMPMIILYEISILVAYFASRVM